MQHQMNMQQPPQPQPQQRYAPQGPQMRPFSQPGYPLEPVYQEIGIGILSLNEPPKKMPPSRSEKSSENANRTPLPIPHLFSYMYQCIISARGTQASISVELITNALRVWSYYSRETAHYTGHMGIMLYQTLKKGTVSMEEIQEKRSLKIHFANLFSVFLEPNLIQLTSRDNLDTEISYEYPIQGSMIQISLLFHLKPVPYPCEILLYPKDTETLQEMKSYDIPTRDHEGQTCLTLPQGKKR